MLSNIDIPNAIAIMGGILTLSLFILKAIIHSSDTKDMDSFFFANKKLTKEGISYNLSATATSLATALLFIILQSPSYGFIIFLVVFLFWGGQWIFLIMTRQIDPSPLHSGSIYRFLYSVLESRSIAIAVNVIAVLNYFILIILELVLGATIFSFLYPQDPNVALYFMVFMSCFIFVYVLLGGFETVAFSDGWQFRLLWASVLMTLLLLIPTYYFKGKPLVELLYILQAPKGDILLWSTFLLNAIVVNLTLPTCQINSWQRFSSSPSYQVFRDGYIQSLSLKKVKTCFVYVWILFVLSAILINKLFGQVSSLQEVFNHIKSSGILGAYLVFPLLFIGLLSALASTADSLFISFALGVNDFKLSQSSTGKIGLKRNIILCFLLVMCSSIAFFLLLQNLQGTMSDKIVSIMFLGVGQATLLFPILYHASTNPNSKFKNEVYPLIGLVLGFIVFWFIGFVGVIKNQLWIVQLCPVVTMPIVYASVKAGGKKQ